MQLAVGILQLFNFVGSALFGLRLGLVQSISPEILRVTRLRGLGGSMMSASGLLGLMMLSGLMMLLILDISLKRGELGLVLLSLLLLMLIGWLVVLFRRARGASASSC